MSYIWPAGEGAVVVAGLAPAGVGRSGPNLEPGTEVFAA